MNDLIMKALLEGFATLIRSFVRTVAKNGLAIMLLVIGFAGAIYVVVWQHDQYRADIVSNRAECEAKIDALNVRLTICEEQRKKQEIDIAVLNAKYLSLIEAKPITNKK